MEVFVQDCLLEWCRGGDLMDAVAQLRGMELLGRFNDHLTRVFDKAFGTQWAEIEEMLAISSIVSIPSLTTRQLAEITRLNRRAVSRMIARMTADGLVYPHPSEADKRAVVVSLTDTGEQRAKVLEASIITFFGDSTDIALQISEGLGPTRAAPATPESTDPMDLLRRVCEAGVALVRSMPDAATHGQLAARQRAALVQIVTTEGARPSDLPPALGVSRAGGAYIVDQLCAKGFVTRHRGAVPEDRRAVILKATDAGVQAVQAVMNGIGQQSEMLAHLFSEIAQWRPSALDVGPAKEPAVPQ